MGPSALSLFGYYFGMVCILLAFFAGTSAIPRGRIFAVVLFAAAVVSRLIVLMEQVAVSRYLLHLP